jgi:integrase
MEAFKTDILRDKYDLGKPTKAILFKDFAPEFLNTHAIRKKSYARDKGALDLHLVPFFGSYPLSDIKAPAIEKYKNMRADEYDGRQKEDAEDRRITSGATINRELALLKTMLNKAVEWEKIKESPVNWRRIKKFTENGRERFLTPAEKARLFEEAGTVSPYLKNFLILAINTGLRKGEILGLCWRNVDLANGEIILEKVRRKNKIALRMPLNHIAIEALNSMPRDSEFVFYNPDTKGPVKDVRTAFETACKKADIKDLRIHDLRHTFATILSDEGFDIMTIMFLLGHSSSAMTEKYITRKTSRMKKAVDVMADVFEDKRGEGQPESRKKAERNSEYVARVEVKTTQTQ